MKLTDVQLKSYHENGYLLLPAYFSRKDIATINQEINKITAIQSPSHAYENNQKTLRAIHGSHLDNEVMAKLVVHQKILEPVKQILNHDVYIHQFKVNLKAALHGQSWTWHQDFTHWHNEDGIPEPKLTNVALYLDDSNAFNGALYLIPKSHREQITNITEKPQDGWIAEHRADLKYILDKEIITKLIEKNGYVCQEAPAGSVLFFHSNMVHASADNISPYDRRLLIISYNDIRNIPDQNREKRAEFLVGRNYTPLQSIDIDEFSPFISV